MLNFKYYGRGTILDLDRQKYQELQELKSKPPFYDYEKTFVDICQNLGHQVLEKCLSQVPKDWRKNRWVAAMEPLK